MRLAVAQVAVGAHFSAGGWSGLIKSIAHDSTSVRTASAGFGVQLTVKLSTLINEPRPLGDKIYFHGPAKSFTAAKEAAEHVMLQNQMEARLGAEYRLS